ACDGVSGAGLVATGAAAAGTDGAGPGRLTVPSAARSIPPGSRAGGVAWSPAGSGAVAPKSGGRPSNVTAPIPASFDDERAGDEAMVDSKPGSAGPAP